MTVLPDPTADLHWSDFAGAIQDIFADNASKYPERRCVLETASSTSPERNFTYRQIHEASNVVAHRLLRDGIQLGDVVMIYAYRGVDLVVAILGTLKAGGAFSVVDPAYPNDRQQIYLDVARPRALIVIEKATREEGGLADSVKSWINQNLELRTTIPGLELLDDGNIRGGSLETGSMDILRDQQSLKESHPGVVCGPDTQPTLSFTSGSEGIPKGCKGRHFSLTYYQSFMAKRFQMGDRDRFTMLSGIAHDPIQRDIFTPMFLGASLLIPPKEAIQHEKLAEWMRTHEPTVTHLTPAMGQILVGGASAQFPSLRNAFFVGDILMKRDCLVLQSLASNCRIVNMFGTTETQRAVSFFDIPSRNNSPDFLDSLGDVVPAGRGMQDVQLLVVDRESLAVANPRLCSAGEIGEIFVRAGGLAEGYLGSVELNKQKFVPNFFNDHNTLAAAEETYIQERGYKEPWRAEYKGPRDRLYRSGDLGKYTESGDCEVVGRADSQIKIRGFRIELGEIDTHLSHHPLVRENVTIVRRDANEEPTLVSYIVPDMQKWPQWLDSLDLSPQNPPETEDHSMAGMLKRFRVLLEDIKTHLRQKLPTYAIPSVIIPLKQMPLTPNAKIDKRVLPYPEAADIAASGIAAKINQDNYSATEKYLAQVWAQRIPGLSADSIDLDDRFIDKGGHSLVGQSVLFDIRKGKSVSLSMNTLFQNPTLREFAAVLDAAANVPNGVKQDIAPPEMDYHLDGEVLNAKFHGALIPAGENPHTSVLVTGATGFLGAHILAELLSRKPGLQVYAHVRAASKKDALRRVRETCEAYGVWSGDWEERLHFVIGDLSKPILGIDPEIWDSLANEIDTIIHNGARVHWVHTYTTLKPTNVLSTVSCIELCSTGRPKNLCFISSTSVLKYPSYRADTAILESDDLCHSQNGLANGYGQTKYVSEQLIQAAGKRGLNGTIIRAGYLMGAAKNQGIGPTDDYLIRMLKGSIQLGCAPHLGDSTINLVPITHCAKLVVASSLHPPSQGVSVVQVTPHPQLPFQTFVGALETYGYNAPIVPYTTWKSKLEAYVASTTSSTSSAIDDIGNPNPTTEQNQLPREPHALLPLFDWVIDDLPRDSVSRMLDDSNAQTVLRTDDPGYDLETESRVTEDTVGKYLAFMVAIGFIDEPPKGGKGKTLPKVDIPEAQRKALEKVGRSGGK